ESKKKWDADDQAGLRFAEKGPLNVEYFRDVQPILRRSCVACHTSKEGRTPAGNLDLDADDTQESVEQEGKFPGTYYRLALDERARYGHKPIGWHSWGYPNASRYVRKLQARRSLPIWKVFGERLDGFRHDDHPPVLTLTYPAPGKNVPLSRLLIGMHDYGSGLDMESFRVTADVAIDDVPAGEDLSKRFRPAAQGVWEWRLSKPLAGVEKAT